MLFEFPIPNPNGEMQISIESGSSLVFVGANGGGKTRLAVYIEDAFQLNAHRISAHRALTLNPGIAKISERDALFGLRTGNASSNAAIAHRSGNRWHGNSATSLLSDFDFLIQVLFAEQANKALETHRKNRAGDHSCADPTMFERLVTIWDRLLPHRQLHISGDNIEVAVRGSDARYNAIDMSDGERAIFYMIAQTLAAAGDSLLIFDEPELHVHPSIMAKLWDELEASRQDCSFVFITHDLEFAATRVAQKFVIRDFDPTPWWFIEAVPENSGFGEEVTTLILGSRQPILFVEGGDNSLDLAIYRCSYPDWTVIPRGSCEEVIHSVVTMGRNEALTRVTCSGIVDADDHQADDIGYLKGLGISVLPVSEIENVILLPAVSRSIAESEGYNGADLEKLLGNLKTAVFETLNSAEAIDAVVTRYCRRRIDRLLKKIDLSEANNVPDITAEYTRQTTTLNIKEIAQQAKDRIEAALRDGDLPKLLANYDNKGMIALAATHLKKSKRVDFESWLTRVLSNNSEPALVTTIHDCLPKI
ncbi:MAG: AAA family ATPase [Rhodospirillaceae bacterium]|jgi:energy-coupling factor transporter ATP-binding protein EcfA2|nr:AAA family ATPase [Rhodospirillaceae bacterium]MBT3884740.1 AAA family ATPase [Rhodospirillaceae bacterium]MBT4117514.1 AAA family ATPase [Rhodospirillaceae bacterium]MBT4670654.1 AAA family ATPase [Rhodospirillaceae bacterium]MBT4720455.1 AAA family ATPase [Rhodospirillaceae bacterium]